MSLFISTKSVFHFFHCRFLRTSAVASTLIPLVLNPITSEKHESVRNFFSSYGFTDAQLAKITARHPRIFKANVEKTLKPKLEGFVHNGFSGSFLHELIAANPYILWRSWDSQLLPTLHLLQTYLGSKEKNLIAVKRYALLLGYGNKGNIERNLIFLVSEGVPLKQISHLICLDARTVQFGVDRMIRAVKCAKQFGFRPADPMFIRAVIVTLPMSESTFTKKIEFVKNLLGCSEEEVHYAFKRYPLFLAYSEEKLKSVTNFFVNTMKVEASLLLSNPVYYGYSVDKRMVPRYNVFKILESKKLLREGTMFTPTLKQSEKWFESNYVVKYLDQVPNIIELYRGFIQTGNNS